jgi:hypothetical protein
MAQLAQVILSLEGERNRIQNQLARVTSALSALNGLATKTSVGSKRRRMSASARARVVAAQKARWTKWRRAKKK